MDALSVFLPIPLFPEGGLASSVVTTVLVGVFVVGILNLRFGWVLSGLVIPGYMVPLLLDKPLAAAVVFAEGIITYALVWFYSEYLSRFTGWSNFFGRDRFFALILVSVGVRVALDGWALPAFGEWLNTSYQFAFDYRNNLHSFGLIVVSLIANNFWKTGLRRGWFPMVVTVGITYLIVRYVLVEFTNFNISSLSFVYEDIAASLLASPKAYIILLTAAFIASRMNLLYGWDFAGILVPSLLALQWYQPEKILVSFVEAIVILLVAHGLLRLPIFQGATIEGARKLMLFFSISYAYKYLLAVLILWQMPELKITDYYGFGYLLPTLLAIKMHSLDQVNRMVRATLQTSLVAGLLATLIGFSLYFVPDFWSPSAGAASTTAVIRQYPGDLIALAREEQVALYNTRQVNSMTPPLGGELDRFRNALRLLRDRAADDTSDLGLASRLLDGLNYDLLEVDQRYLVLIDRAPRRHWGMYVIDQQGSGKMLIEVPAPLDERGTVEAGLELYRQLPARALALAGAARHANKDGSADPLLNPGTPFLVFHQIFARNDVLQVRAYTPESSQVLGGPRPGDGGTELTGLTELAEPPSQLWVKRQLPSSVDLGELQRVAGQMTVIWGSSPLPNVPRETVHGGFAELILNQDRLRALIGSSLPATDPVRLVEQDVSIEDYLQDRLLGSKTEIAPAGSNAYQLPSVADLLYFDGEIIGPLLRADHQHYRSGAWSAAGLSELRRLQASAAAFGYELIRYRHRISGNDYLVLGERATTTKRRYWGTYALRLGEARSILVQVPRPGYEANSLELALSLFESTRARALLIGGTHPEANQDQSSDLVRSQFRSNLFNTISQAILRDFGDAPGLVAQVRAFGIRRDLAPVPVDVVVASASGAQSAAQLSNEGQFLYQQLAKRGLSADFAGSTPETAGIEAATLPQALYLAATRNKEFMALWASALDRSTYGQKTEPSPQEMQFRALDIPERQTDVYAYLEGRATDHRLPDQLRSTLGPYFASQDIVLLATVQQRYPELRLERIDDVNSRQRFLAVNSAEGRLLAMINLTARQSDSSVELPANDRRHAISRFVDTRAAWLLPSAAATP